jgi:hypothetical protein
MQENAAYIRHHLTCTLSFAVTWHKIKHVKFKLHVTLSLATVVSITGKITRSVSTPELCSMIIAPTANSRVGNFNWCTWNLDYCIV